MNKWGKNSLVIYSLSYGNFVNAYLKKQFISLEPRKPKTWKNIKFLIKTLNLRVLLILTKELFSEKLQKAKSCSDKETFLLSQTAPTYYLKKLLMA